MWLKFHVLHILIQIILFKYYISPNHIHLFAPNTRLLFMQATNWYIVQLVYHIVYILNELILIIQRYIKIWMCNRFCPVDLGIW